MTNLINILCLILFFSFSIDSFAANEKVKVQSVNPNLMKSIAKPFTPKCETKCIGPDMQQVYELNNNSECVPKFSVPCYPYKCNQDTGVCTSSCTSIADCSYNAACEIQQNICTPPFTDCADEFTLSHADGTKIPCYPYRCIGSSCISHCEKDYGCIDGYKCVQQHCIKK